MRYGIEGLRGSGRPRFSTLDYSCERACAPREVRTSGAPGDRLRCTRIAGLRCCRSALDLLHVARQLAAVFHDQAAVANRPTHTPGAMDDKARARRDLAREIAVHLGDVDERRALERAGLLDLHHLAVHRGLDL